MGVCAVILGRVRKHMGDGDGALDAFMAAVEVFRGTGNRDYEGIALLDIGTVYQDRGRYREAEIYYKQSLAIDRELADRAGEAATLHRIGGAYSDQGRFPEALETYQLSLSIRRELENQSDEA
jgi:tetratricopeptide (TPR) repeat protein